MDSTINDIEKGTITPMKNSFGEAEEEIKFEELVNLYIAGKISYEDLLDEYPVYHQSMLRRVLKLISSYIN